MIGMVFALVLISIYFAGCTERAGEGEFCRL